MTLKSEFLDREVVPSAVYCSLVKLLAAFVAEVGISKVFFSAIGADDEFSTGWFSNLARALMSSLDHTIML